MSSGASYNRVDLIHDLILIAAKVLPALPTDSRVYVQSQIDSLEMLAGRKTLGAAAGDALMARALALFERLFDKIVTGLVHGTHHIGSGMQLSRRFKELYNANHKLCGGFPHAELVLGCGAADCHRKVHRVLQHPRLSEPERHAAYNDAAAELLQLVRAHPVTGAGLAGGGVSLTNCLVSVGVASTR